MKIPTYTNSNTNNSKLHQPHITLKKDRNIIPLQKLRPHSKPPLQTVSVLLLS